MAAAEAIPAESSFHDYLPLMARKLGEHEFMEELCKGFELLADPATGTITLASLRRNAPLLGLGEMSEEEFRSMVLQGDFDGDGALNQQEFCILMVRLSPSLLEEWLQDVIEEELQGFAMDEDEDDQVKVVYFS